MAEFMFSKAGKGYNRDEVDSYLLELNRRFTEKETVLRDEIKRLTTELADADQRYSEAALSASEKEEALFAALKAKEEECASMQASIGQRMIIADDRAAQIVSDANAKAEALIAEANQTAEKLREDAIRSAKEESEQIIRDTELRCETISGTASVLSRQLSEIQMLTGKAEKLINDSFASAKSKLPDV